MLSPSPDLPATASPHISASYFRAAFVAVLAGAQAESPSPLPSAWSAYCSISKTRAELALRSRFFFFRFYKSRTSSPMNAAPSNPDPLQTASTSSGAPRSPFEFESVDIVRLASSPELLELASLFGTELLPAQSQAEIVLQTISFNRLLSRNASTRDDFGALFAARYFPAPLDIRMPRGGREPPNPGIAPAQAPRRLKRPAMALGSLAASLRFAASGQHPQAPRRRGAPGRPRQGRQNFASS